MLQLTAPPPLLAMSITVNKNTEYRCICICTCWWWMQAFGKSQFARCRHGTCRILPPLYRTKWAQIAKQNRSARSSMANWYGWSCACKMRCGGRLRPRQWQYDIAYTACHIASFARTDRQKWCAAICHRCKQTEHRRVWRSIWNQQRRLCAMQLQYEQIVTRNKQTKPNQKREREKKTPDTNQKKKIN